MLVPVSNKSATSTMALDKAPASEGTLAPSQGLNGPRGREVPPLAPGNGAAKDIAQMSPVVVGEYAPLSLGYDSPAQGHGPLGERGYAPPSVTGDVASLARDGAPPAPQGQWGDSSQNRVSILNSLSSATNSSQVTITNNPDMDDSAINHESVISVTSHDPVNSAISHESVISVANHDPVNSVTNHESVNSVTNYEPVFSVINKDPENNPSSPNLNPSIFRDHNAIVIINTVLFYITTCASLAQAVLCDKINNFFGEQDINLAHQIMIDLNLTKALRSQKTNNNIKTRIYNLVKIVRDTISHNPHITIATVSTDLPPASPITKKSHLGLPKFFQRKPDPQQQQQLQLQPQPQLQPHIDALDDKVTRILQLQQFTLDVMLRNVPTQSSTHPQPAPSALPPQTTPTPP